MPVNAEHRRISKQAAEWIIALTADDARQRADARTRFEAWKRADPRHAAAALRMETLLRQLHAHHGQPARAALRSAQRTARTSALASAAAMLVLAAVAVMVGTDLPLNQPGLLFADMRTGTGEWQTRTLSDGSRITLSSDSAINVDMRAQQRSITLLRGEMLVDVARAPARPFFVQTDDGSIRALGTRFTVQRYQHATELAMLESKAEVRAVGNPAAANVVTAGEQVRITPAGLGPMTPINVDSLADAWRDHQLVVQNRPLAEVLDQLARHHRGILHYDARQIAAMRVSAVLPLDDTERALHLLLNSFPSLRIRTMTRYLVLVDAPAPEK